MLLRCPDSRRFGLASLASCRWIIAGDGYASVIPGAAHRAEGVLFNISASDEAAPGVHNDQGGVAITPTWPSRFVAA